MTIAERPKVSKAKRRQHKPDASQLLNELINNRYCVGLLRFFAMHPNGRFTKLAVIHALDEEGTIPEIDKNLANLAHDGIITISIENKTRYYTLTVNEPTRRLILNLAEFDWRQWQKLDNCYIADRRISD